MITKREIVNDCLSEICTDWQQYKQLRMLFSSLMAMENAEFIQYVQLPIHEIGHNYFYVT